MWVFTYIECGCLVIVTINSDIAPKIVCNGGKSFFVMSVLTF